MNSDLVELGWTDDLWNRICSVVTEEAQKARVGAQVLPVVGPEDASTLAVPHFRTSAEKYGLGAPERLVVNSDPELYITRIAVNVYLRSTRWRIQH